MRLRTWLFGISIAGFVTLPAYASVDIEEFPRTSVEPEKVWEIKFNEDLGEEDVEAVVDIVKVGTEEEEVMFDVTKIGSGVYEIDAQDYELGSSYLMTVEGTDSVVMSKTYSKRFDVSNGVGSVSYDNRIGSDFGEFEWLVYHDDYERFVMEGSSVDGRVLGGYSTDDVENEYGIVVGSSSKADVRNLLGTPVEYISKGDTNYTIDGNGEYETYLVGDRYVTVFYDIYNNGLVRSVLWVDKGLQEDKPHYASPDDSLVSSSEDLMVELINETRVGFGLRPLSYDVAANEVGRKHSQNMVDQDFFDHTDKDGKGVGDRLVAAGYQVSFAGENLAYGQLNTIYAHEGLMNSLGHRENILNENYERVGVGAAFKEDGTPYFTVVFYKN